MSDDDGRYKGSGIKVGALVGALLLSYFVLPPIKRFFGRTAELTALADPNRVDATLLADPAAGEAIRVIKTRFPADYARLRTDVLAKAQARDETGLSGSFDRVVIAIIQRDAAKLAQAPHAALARLSAAELAIFRALSPRPALCAAFGTPAFDGGTLGPETQATIRAALPIRLAAIADGRDAPSGVKPIASPAEGRAMVNAALAGRAMRPETYELLTGARTPQATTDRGRCEASIEFLRAVRDMPADEGDALYGALLAST